MEGCHRFGACETRKKENRDDEWLLLGVGLALGGAVGWFWAKSSATGRLATLQIEAEGKVRAAESAATELRAQIEALRQSLDQVQEKLRAEGELRATAEARLQEAQANLEEQKKLLDDAQRKLADTFNALAAEALKSNNQAFMALAKSTFETIQAQAKGDLETRQKAIEGMVAPLRESLERYEKQILEMEKRPPERLRRPRGAPEQLGRRSRSCRSRPALWPRRSKAGRRCAAAGAK